MLDRDSMAFSSSPPIKTLSGFCKSLIALPSDKNSGFDNTEKFFLFLIQNLENLIKFLTIVSAVFTGNVLFSTTIV